MKVLPGIAARHGAAINLIPCLLGGILKLNGNQALSNALAGIKGKLDLERSEIVRYLRGHGLSGLHINPHFPINTPGLMRGIVAAQSMRVDEAYLDAVLLGMEEDGEKLEDAEVFLAVLNRAGIDGAALIALSDKLEIKSELAANTDAAVARGAFGIPTFFVGEEMFFGRERLCQIDVLMAGLAAAA